MEIGNNLAYTKSKNLGFTYIGILMLIAISGIGLAGVGIVWHQDMQREREKELLFIGEEYRKAIGSYYMSSPTPVKQFPKTLKDLIIDNRSPEIKRHLRKLYTDPITHDKPWQLVLQQDGIVGVYSESKLKPLKKYGFLRQYEEFGNAQEYNEWKFIYNGPTSSDAVVTSAVSVDASAQN
ncbi:MAG TPA: type II secretion system protein [Methylotenera sp.]|nr:type II secretion system protein [Methylotenera sp.]